MTEKLAMTRPRGCATTGVSDLPFTDAESAITRVLERHPEVPFWPRLPRRDTSEGMIGQFLDSFPYLQYRRPTLRLSVQGNADAMRETLERIRRRDASSAAPPLSTAAAAGWHELIARLEAMSDEERPAFVRALITGPVTAASLAQDVEGRSLLEFPGYLEAFAVYLEGIALQQVDVLRGLGCTPIVALEEPLLYRVDPGVDEEAADRILAVENGLLSALRDAGALTLVHCEGALHWDFFFRLETDWIGFDTSQSLRDLSSHRDELAGWVERGNGLGIGIVPTVDVGDDFDPAAAVNSLVEVLTAALGSYEATRTLMRHSLVTAATGTMMRTVEEDEVIAARVQAVSECLREQLEI